MVLPRLFPNIDANPPSPFTFSLHILSPLVPTCPPPQVWHLHIASPDMQYAEDIALITSGHTIEHHPVLADVAKPRYLETRRQAVALVDAAGERVLGGADKGKPLTSETAFWRRVWPVLPPEPAPYIFQSDDEVDYDMDEEGCC